MFTENISDFVVVPSKLVVQFISEISFKTESFPFASQFINVTSGKHHRMCHSKQEEI